MNRCALIGMSASWAVTSGITVGSDRFGAGAEGAAASGGVVQGGKRVIAPAVIWSGGASWSVVVAGSVARIVSSRAPVVQPFGLVTLAATVMLVLARSRGTGQVADGRRPPPR